MTPISLTFDTGRARTRSGWRAFYLARDKFAHAMLRRQGYGLPFGRYTMPSGETIDTWLTPEDLKAHTLILGGTGSGKSSLLESIARLHFMQRSGVALLDLHGDLYQRTANWALHANAQRLVLLDFSKPDALPSWNPLAPMPGVDPGRQVDLLVGVLKRLWADEVAASWAWGVATENITRWIVRACIESRVPSSLIDLRSYLMLPVLRQKLLASTSAETRKYFKRWSGKEEQYVSAVLNKLDPFLSSIAVQRFLGQRTSDIDLFDLVDNGGTLLINLPRGYMGPTADVVGRLLVNVLQTAALRREAMRPEARVPFSIMLDEAHNLADRGSGLEDLLVAARKYRVSVTLAAQSLSLFPPSFRPHLLGNTGRQFFFRMPHAEAQKLAPDLFEPQGTIWREAVRPYDSLADPLLTPREEIEARTRELSNLPVGACYWAIKGRRFRARRIQVNRPTDLPLSRTEFERRAWEVAERTKRRRTPDTPDAAGGSPFGPDAAEANDTAP